MLPLSGLFRCGQFSKKPELLFNAEFPPSLKNLILDGSLSSQTP